MYISYMYIVIRSGAYHFKMSEMMCRWLCDEIAELGVVGGERSSCHKLRLMIMCMLVMVLFCACSA